MPLSTADNNSETENQSENEIYPSHLIPKVDSKIISIIDGADYLGKWVESDVELKDSDGRLSPDAIEVNRIPGFSTNKIPESQKEDLYIKFKDEYKKEYNNKWNVGDVCKMPLEDHYELDKARQYYFIEILKIHNYSEIYYNPPTDTKNAFRFTVIVVHKPLVANYWHFELTIEDNNGNPISTSSGKWRKLICSTIRTRIQQNAIFDFT